MFLERILPFAFALLLLACQEPISITPMTGATNVRFCDLLSRPDAPDKKLIRVSGIFVDAFEYTCLRDPDCKGEAWIRFDPDMKNHTDRKLMDQLSWKSSRGVECKVVFIGFVEGPLPAASLKRSNMLGYGHMGSFPLQITVQSIESVD